MEIIYENVHKKMNRLKGYLGKELYHIYYKMSCDIIECKGDLENAYRYLKQCRSISKELGLNDSQVIDMKLGEIEKIRNRRNDEKHMVQAKDCIKVGDMYMHSGRIKDALSQYEQALKLSKDIVTEIEAISHFKIGRTILHMLNQKIQ
jgi:tetratricopeptide (TPR) repeat protein